ncbi:SAGA-associated factor 11 [Pseudozyma hubeiensis]|nr:SAGA-associated factor 11 [Pseudozyma hubeiensis]
MSSDPKALLAAKFLDSFLREIVLDTAIHTHAKIKRARSICHLCGVRCQAHNPAAQPSSSSSNFAISSDTSTPSRPGTPAPGSSTSASHKPDYYSNNPLFECLVCSRQVSSNRYATHLAKCMGMGSKGGRKGAARNAKAATSVLTSSSRQSAAGTPRYSSDLDEDSFSKRKNGNAVSKNGTKRASSPLAASTLANARMNKRLKTSSPTPPPAESAAGGLNRSYSSQTFAPSGLSSSTVISGSPLNPNNNGATSKVDASARSKNAASSKKRKRFVDDDDDEGGDQYHDASAADSNGEEGEISDDDDEDDDDDVALATANSSQPPASRTKIKIPVRATSTSSASASTSKPKTFIVADDSDDSDTNLSNRRKTHTVSDDDDEADDDDDDDDDAEDDDDDDDDEEDDDDDDVQVTRVTHSSTIGANGASGGGARKKKSSAANGSGLQRERGSDGEFIDVESASEQSDADSF